MIFGTGKFRIKETNLGTFEIEKQTIAGWSAMAFDGGFLDFSTREEAERVLEELQKEWNSRAAKSRKNRR
ncbi:hypothetical protein P9705_001275 [Enterococcus faecalis]|nr:hypothetical protein [Enterococcus faecalis]